MSSRNNYKVDAIEAEKRGDIMKQNTPQTTSNPDISESITLDEYKKKLRENEMDYRKFAITLPDESGNVYEISMPKITIDSDRLKCPFCKKHLKMGENVWMLYKWNSNGKFVSTRRCTFSNHVLMHTTIAKELMETFLRQFD